jgi:hypothetical protein
MAVSFSTTVTSSMPSPKMAWLTMRAWPCNDRSASGSIGIRCPPHGIVRDDAPVVVTEVGDDPVPERRSDGQASLHDDARAVSSGVGIFDGTALD